MKRSFRQKTSQRAAPSIGLRQRAEAELRSQPKELRSTAESQRLLHELQVHQIELEMQNAELRQARDEREASLENYTDLYDFAPVGYFTLAVDSTIQQVNLTGAGLVGVDRARLVGRCFDQLLPSTQQPIFRNFLKIAFSKAGKQSGEFELMRSSQVSRTVRLEAQRLPDQLTCRVVVLDVTARKLAEDQMRVSEVRYRRLFEAAHDGVLLLDPRTRKITDANPFMTRLLGYSHAQLLGKELFEIGLVKDEVASQEAFQKLKREHQVRYENLPLKNQTGKLQEVEVVANLYQENGHTVIQCNIRDITERKAAAEVMRRSEALFATLIAQVPVGMYVVDAQFCLQQINPKALLQFGKIRPLMGRDFAEIVRLLWPRAVANRVIALFRYTLKTGEPYYSPEFAERRQDTGAQEVYEWQIQRITLPAGGFGVVCFYSNITAHKQAEATQRRAEVLAASNQKLEAEIIQRLAVEKSLMHSQQLKTRLLEEARHMQGELRHLSREVLRVQEAERKRISRELHDVIAQTLTGINVRLATLKKESGRSRADFNRNLERTQLLISKSVDVVHQFARELRPAVLDDVGLIPALHAFMKDFTARTGIRTHLMAFAGVEKLDIAKRTALYRVAQEALTNVSRHAQASRVEVSLQKIAGCLSLKIKDNGKSFQVQRILHAQGSKRLGLLGMRERVEMVGGTFGVESARGTGTTIQVILPFVGKPKSR